jgi:chloramphenicol 3-O-phosphotransferase
MNPAIIFISGNQGAGKSTIGPLLAARFERGAFIDADTLAWMTVSGQAWVMEPGAPISAEADEQLRLRLHHACLLARSYYDAGYTAVAVDIIAGDRWDQLKAELRGVPFYFVHLDPAVESVIAREAARGKRTVLGPKWAHYLDGEFRSTMAGVGLWIDTTRQTPEETVDEILQRLDEGLIESES